MEIYGDTSGLSPSETTALQRIYRRRVPLERLTTPELTRALVGVSHSTGRQVGVLVDRRGTVHNVILGDASKLMLPDVGRMRAGAGRLLTSARARSSRFRDRGGHPRGRWWCRIPDH